MSSEPALGDARSRLAELRTATTQRMQSLTRSFEAIVETAGQGATDDEHDPEGHTSAWERQQMAALLEEAKAKLGDIERAEARLAVGGYGTCVRCGRDISTERLHALPVTTRCIKCATVIDSTDESRCRRQDTADERRAAGTLSC